MSTTSHLLRWTPTVHSISYLPGLNFRDEVRAGRGKVADLLTTFSVSMVSFSLLERGTEVCVLAAKWKNDKLFSKDGTTGSVFPNVKGGGAVVFWKPVFSLCRIAYCLQQCSSALGSGLQ